MCRIYLSLLFAITLLTVPIASYSNPWGWLVQKTSGSAVYSWNSDAQLALQKGLVLDRGATVQTGDSGRVLLVRGEESVFIGPYTVASIAAQPTDMSTTVILQSGRASFAVRKKPQKHFSVETPFLAAVVKGTKFDIAVGPSSAEVSVTEGVVEVRALKSGEVADLLPGQTAVVDNGGNLVLTSKRTAVEREQPEATIVENVFASEESQDPKDKSGKGKSGKGSSGSGKSGKGSSGKSGQGSSGSGSSGSSGSGGSGSGGGGGGDD